MAGVKFVDATRIYPGATVPSVNKLNLDIPDGEFWCWSARQDPASRPHCECWPV